MPIVENGPSTFGISDVKRKARVVFKRNLWMAVIACLLLSLLSFNNFGVEFSEYGQAVFFQVFTYKIYLGEISAWVFSSLSIILLIASIAFALLVYNPIAVGIKAYIKNMCLNTQKFEDIMFAFRSKNYWTIVKANALLDLYVFLGLLCFFIPGIIIAYRYMYLPYILHEYPELSASEAMEKCRELTKGVKLDLLLLHLSFILWFIACAFTFGIGNIFLTPYIDLSVAWAYLDTKVVKYNEAEVEIIET